jgi:hypothetical protein
MATREQFPEKFIGRGNSFSETASRAASVIDDGLHRGADVVSRVAHQTAEQFGRASGYAQKQGIRLRQKATDAGVFANEHPRYLMLAAGVTGFALGMLVRRRRVTRIATTGLM